MPVRIRTVVVFGDSLSDIGQKWNQPMGMFANNAGLMVVNATGRFSDCRNWTDYMYEEAGGSSLIVSDAKLSFQLSQVYMNLTNKSWAYGYANKTDKNFQYVNYAEGGACGDTPATLINRGALGTFKEQVDKFEESCKNVDIALGNTLFIIWFGANDLYTAGCKPESMSGVALQVAHTQRDRLKTIVTKNEGACWFVFVNLARPLTSVRYAMRLKKAKDKVKEKTLPLLPENFRTGGYKPIGGYAAVAREQGWAKKQLKALDAQMKEIEGLEIGVLTFNSALDRIAKSNGDRVVAIGSLFTEDAVRALVRGNYRGIKAGAATTPAVHVSAADYDLLSEKPDFSVHISTIDEAHPCDAVYRLIWKEIYKVLTDALLFFGNLQGIEQPTVLSQLAQAQQ